MDYSEHILRTSFHLLLYYSAVIAIPVALAGVVASLLQRLVGVEGSGLVFLAKLLVVFLMVAMFWASILSSLQRLFTLIIAS